MPRPRDVASDQFVVIRNEVTDLIKWCRGEMNKKNIIVFMADQLNADTVTKPGRKAITPNLDAFRCDATQFDQAYTSLHIVVSRVAFFSSLYPSQVVFGTMLKSITPYPRSL
jgi:arylsulfatase A-like enzyme